MSISGSPGGRTRSSESFAARQKRADEDDPKAVLATRGEWRDTVLIRPRQDAELAFVADNPGDWKFDCHILDHQEGGMMSVLRVN